VLKVFLIENKDVHPIHVERVNLIIVSSAVYQYRIDHGRLPSEEGFRDELAEYLEDASILSKIKYFRQGDEFVLVSPWKNKKFDTPDGFQNIRDFKGESDDLVLLSPIFRRRKTEW
jgi:hypothetical protein